MNKKICREIKFVSTHILRPHSGHVRKIGKIDKNETKMSKKILQEGKPV